MYNGRLKIINHHFWQKWHNLGTPLSTKNPPLKNKNKSIFRLFSIGCQGYVSGGLLKDTFFKFKFLFKQKWSDFNKICWQCQQRVKLLSYVILHELTLFVASKRPPESRIGGPRTRQSREFLQFSRFFFLQFNFFLSFWRLKVISFCFFVYFRTKKQTLSLSNQKQLK